MVRLIALLTLAFLVPFVAHGVVTIARGRGFQPLPTKLRGRLWLVVIGAGLALATLLSLMGRAPQSLGERYIPAHMEGSVLVPGRFEKAE
jgi:multisubunit Na+/H+ antiporter MnhB subunit